MYFDTALCKVFQDTKDIVHTGTILWIGTPVKKSLCNSMIYVHYGCNVIFTDFQVVANVFVICFDDIFILLYLIYVCVFKMLKSDICKLVHRPPPQEDKESELLYV